MKNVLDALEKYYPDAVKLLMTSRVEDFSVIDKYNFPIDFVSLYSVLDGEDENSSGVFGLYRLNSLEEAIDSIISEVARLDCSIGHSGFYIPIFQSPGRETHGYALVDNEWIFLEHGLGLECLPDKTLTDYLNSFIERVKSNEYLYDAKLKGLVHRSEL